MQVQPMARYWFAVNALVVAVGMAVQLPVAYNADEGRFTGWGAVANVFCYFTVHSNLAVGLTCAMVALGAGSTALWFRTVRLIGVIGIALTFVVFHLLLRDLQDLTGQAALADFLLHTVSPILAVSGWLLFGPRGLTSRTVIWWLFAYLVVWGGLTLLRGHFVEYDFGRFYPYPFMNPDYEAAGYVKVAITLVIIGVVFVGLAIGAHALDSRLARRQSVTPDS